MEALWYDLRFGLRRLRNAPLASAAIVGTLALAIGANTALFSVLRTTVLKTLPFRDASRLMWITSVRPERLDAPFSLPEFLDYSRQTRTLDGLAAYANWSAILSGGGDAERLQGMRISANGFDVLGTRAALGRLFRTADDDASAGRVALISYGLWRRRFASRADVLGQSLRLNAESYVIVGVLPASLPLPIRDVDVAVPLAPDRDPWRNVRSSTNFLRFIGRLRSGVPRLQAESELTAICGRLREQFPVEYAVKRGVRLLPLKDALLGDSSRTMVLLFCAVTVVLAVACANLLNVLLLKAVARQRETAVRSAVGATRARLVRQSVTEAAVTTLLGAAGGVLLAWVGVKVLVAFGPATLPRLRETSIDLPVFLFTAVISASLALVLGALPAVHTGGAMADPLRVGRGSAAGAPTQRRVRSAFVTMQVASAFALLVAGGLMVDSLLRLQAVDVGFRPQGVFVARVSLPGVSYTTPAQLFAFVDRLTADLEHQPGVTSLGAVSVAPFSGLLASVEYTVVGATPASPDARPAALYRLVTPGYFETVGARLIKGRLFTEYDRVDAPLVGVVSKALADRLAPGGDPIGMQVRIDDSDGPPRPVEIVGVIANITQVALEGSASSDLYLPMRQIDPGGVVWLANNQFWMMRTSTPPAAFGERFRRALRNADPDAAASNAGDLEDYVSGSMASRRFNTVLIVLFAVAAALLAGIGLYTVVSYSIGQRGGEIAVRMALGATPRRIHALVVREGLTPIVIGWMLGALATLAAGRVLVGMLYDVTPTQPFVLLGATGGLLAIGAAAIVVPARRAASAENLRLLQGH